jgi:hypothetical protein
MDERARQHSGGHDDPSSGQPASLSLKGPRCFRSTAEATGRGSALAYSVPDDVESAYAALEVARLRRAWGVRLRIHLDLAGRAAVAATVAAMP